MNTQYWEEEIETMSREKLQELQLQRLKKTINIAANAPYYKEVFSKHNITADNIQSLDDIRKIPFTTKADMRANYPFGLVAGDMQNDGEQCAGCRVERCQRIAHNDQRTRRTRG